MVCYIVPAAASAIIFGSRKKLHQDNEKIRRLNMLMSGGAIFGLVDHLWNGELFLIGPNFVSDIMLGFAITGVILISWLAMEAFSLPSASGTTAK